MPHKVLKARKFAISILPWVLPLERRGSKELNLRNFCYHKIIIMTDADGTEPYCHIDSTFSSDI